MAQDAKHWYSSSSGRIELEMTLEQARSVSHQGQCDEDVRELSKVPEIRVQLDATERDVLAAELKEYGAWGAEELADHEQNLRRILWLAGGDIAEEVRQ
jgi:folate-binding Fe-S cluster repair protein YgfZ